MPTTKKSVKKPSVKRTAAKKSGAKKWVLAPSGNYESFKLAKSPKFFSTKITDQTIYWSILGFLVLAIGIWIITINDRVQYLYDQIDLQNAESGVVIPLKK